MCLQGGTFVNAKQQMCLHVGRQQLEPLQSQLRASQQQSQSAIRIISSYIKPQSQVMQVSMR